MHDTKLDKKDIITDDDKSFNSRGMTQGNPLSLNDENFEKQMEFCLSVNNQCIIKYTTKEGFAYFVRTRDRI